jgi:hypothetical protein
VKAGKIGIMWNKEGNKHGERCGNTVFLPVFPYISVHVYFLPCFTLFQFSMLSLSGTLVNFTPRGHFPLTPELQVETSFLSHVGASPLAVLHSLSGPCPRLSLHKLHVSLAGFQLFLDFLTLEYGTDTLS